MRASIQVLSIVGLSVIFFLAACQNEPESNETPPTVEMVDAYQQYFAQYDVEGSFLLYDLNNNHYVHVNQERNGKGFIPASTFKILNSLIGLESGVIVDENHVIKWDGTEHDFSVWNRDHTLATAIQNSVVWYYQEVARQVGRDEMQRHVERAQYGNRNINGNIDSFWLDGEIRISPEEQIEFLRMLYLEELHFSSRSMEIVKEILVLEEQENFRLSAKTGLGLRVDPIVGWWVGYVEADDNVYFFVINIESENPQPDFQSARFEITNQIFDELGLPMDISGL